MNANLQYFKHVNSYFLKKRRDFTFTQSALLSYAIYKKTDLVVQYTHIEGDSNIATYNYQREILSAGIEFKL